MNVDTYILSDKHADIVFHKFTRTKTQKHKFTLTHVNRLTHTQMCSHISTQFYLSSHEHTNRFTPFHRHSHIHWHIYSFKNTYILKLTCLYIQLPSMSHVSCVTHIYWYAWSYSSLRRSHTPMYRFSTTQTQTWSQIPHTDTLTYNHLHILTHSHV